MPRVWRTLVCGLALAGCVGGQTGEITELGACREDVGEADLSALTEALDALSRRRTVEVAWSEAGFAEGSTEVTFEVLERGPARTVGGEGCARPYPSSPASVTVRSADGALDEVLEGTLARVADGQILVRASRDAAALEGTGALPSADGALWIELTLREGATSGAVRFEPDAEAQDGVGLALF